MRTFLWLVLIAVSTVSLETAQQRPPDNVVQDAQKRVEQGAKLTAEQLAQWAKNWQAGALHPEAELAFRRWQAAIWAWRKERNAGAAPLLAEGVFFDCLARLEGVKTSIFRGEASALRFADVADRRPDRAVRAFKAVLKIDPNLTEARMRAARINAGNDVHAARELEAIAGDRPESPFSYLAALSRAAVAHARSDTLNAVAWYERARSLNPRSTAAAIGISALQPGMPLSFEALDANDLYYTYPCRILTTDIADALIARIQKTVQR